jgi:hypothetical protein
LRFFLSFLQSSGLIFFFNASPGGNEGECMHRSKEEDHSSTGL